MTDDRPATTVRTAGPLRQPRCARASARWVRDRERQNPRAVYEQAIDERARQYAS